MQTLCRACAWGDEAGLGSAESRRQRTFRRLHRFEHQPRGGCQLNSSTTGLPWSP